MMAPKTKLAWGGGAILTVFAIVAVLFGWLGQNGPYASDAISDAAEVRVGNVRPKQGDALVARVAQLGLSINPIKATAETEVAEKRLSAQVAEAVLQASTTGLQLTESELSRLQECVIRYQAIRAAFERELITIERTIDGQVVARIPAYVDAGNELKRMFIDDLKEALGPEIYAQLDEHLGSYLEQRFGGFGTASQEFRIEPNPGSFLGPYKLTHTYEVVEGARTLHAYPFDTVWTGAISQSFVSKEELENNEFSPLAGSNLKLPKS